MAGLRLLIVDDEAALADLLKRYLERMGYRPDVFPNPSAAIEAAGACADDPYGLLITDLSLEEMSGDELVEKIRELLPGLPAIIASGYAHEPTGENVAFLQKPFLPKMLVDLIERTTGSGRTES